ncbi:protein-glutamine gamma-glutamyltransferase 2 isoform X3 [Chiloscyllium plagiosum]|uniref:protein-glutamine gamma-glutamyltransferase 2 isoform X3 n=1 Tax=Chiloscyllium plagiosum TaxID=36176 RepID=UPI001CB7BB3A|nr:protein-glutamine gamma-glutamyltransferase 2 isoform X3 [Chiloscyllium plagiosum]
MATNDIYLGAVDLQCETNNTEHHTIEIEKDRLLVRRGQEFRLRVEFRERTYLEGEDQLAMFVHTGPAPSEADGTRIQVLHSKLKRGKWTFCLQATPGYVHLAVQSPPNACTGHYQIYLVLYPSGGASIQQITAGDFHLLFNPWCQEDAVYLPDEDLLQEYILNENGLLYHGSYTNIYTLPWNFGQVIFPLNFPQSIYHFLCIFCVFFRDIVPSFVICSQFEKDVIDICFQILDNSLSALKDSLADVARRNDPVYVSRIVTAMVNANDDKGVLLGRWDGNYADGIAPTRWTGSLQILRQWSGSGAEKVRYGQCWVFAAVACTVLRCLGIPSRCITNYSSAHDTDGNLKVDQYYSSEDYSRIPSKRKDMVWNYHCWLEVWMTRPDLPPGYDGWQVLDPTPQERSDGSTKEREVYSKAGMKIRSANIQENDLRISIKYAQPILGSDFDIYFSIVNNGFMDKDIHLTLSATTITYNGFILTQFSKRSTTFTLKAATVQKEVLRLKYRDYGEHLSEHNLIRMTAVLIPKGTSEVSLKECDIALNLPRLTVKVIGEPILHRELTVQIKFANPLPITLTDGIFSVEGTGLTHLQEIKSPTTAIHPGQEVVVNVSFTPNKTGLRKLMVDFDSSRLHDVKGSTKIIVRRA